MQQPMSRRRAGWLIVTTLALAVPLAARSTDVDRRAATIRWDRWGVPHITAPDDRSLAYAFGWAQMEAHADTLLRLYGAARGRAAAYWGSEHLEDDIRVHRLGVPRRAEAWLAQQSPAWQGRLQAFAAGMNDWAAAHPRQVEAEQRRVLPVRASDPLAHLQIAIHWQVVAFAAAQQIGGWQHGGSNAIAVGPGRSASGRSMLVVQPHPPWLPGHRFFEAHLSAPGIDAYGVASLGLPILSMGFNADLGWGHTFNPVDGMDLYTLERVAMADGTAGYRFDGGVRRFATETVSLSVRGRDGRLAPHRVTIERTVHGPVLENRSEGDRQRALAIRIAGLDRPYLFAQYDDMARATDLATFERALRRQQMPLLNVVYADRHGRTLYLYNALTPERTPPDPARWLGIVDGEAASTVWGPYRAYDALPRIVDPPSGFVRNSNDAPRYATWPPMRTRPVWVGDRSAGAFDLRAQQSLALVEGSERLGFEDLVAIEASTRSLAADRFLPTLVRLARTSEDPALHRSAMVLETWDRTFDATSRGGVLFVEWLRDLDEVVAERWNATQPRATPRGLRPGPALEALARAVESVEQRWGRLDVAWGEVYRIRHAGLDLPASVGVAEAGAFRVGFFRPDEDGKRSLLGGVSWTAVVAFGSRPRARGLLAYGNATEPGRPGVTEQLHRFSDNRLRPMLFEAAEVRRQAVETEVLVIPVPGR